MPRWVHACCLPRLNPDGTFARVADNFIIGHRDECELPNRRSSLWRRFWATIYCDCPCHKVEPTL